MDFEKTITNFFKKNLIGNFMFILAREIYFIYNSLRNCLLNMIILHPVLSEEFSYELGLINTTTSTKFLKKLLCS